MFRKWGLNIFFGLMLLLLLSPLATLIRREPTLAVAVKTWSMEPVITRGDIVFLLPAGEETDYSPGQIIVFRSEEDGIRDWILHRIVEGEPESGFITKGDANEFTDQEGSGYPPIKKEWIAGVVPTVGQKPLKIPLLGHLPLFLESNVKNPFLLPVFLGVLAAALVLDEIFKSKKRRKKEALQSSQLFFLGGIAFAVIIGAVMILGSLFITLPYGVEENPGVLMGSPAGVLEQGTIKEITLVQLKNEGMLPSIYYAVSSDPQVYLPQEKCILSPGDETVVVAEIHALEPGLHEARITIGMFLPFLPVPLIGFLTSRSYWLAVTVLALLPALPLFILPLLDSRQRLRLARKWRKRLARISSYRLF